MTDRTAAAPRQRSQFFFRSAAMMLALVLASFSFTFFAPLVTGSQAFPAIFLLHAAIFFGWMMLYVWQSWLVASGRTARHREWGLAGIALSTLIVPLGVAIAIAAARRRVEVGHPHAFDNTLFNVVDLVTFGVMTIAGIAATARHPDWHRRLMFAAALCLVGPALSRWLVFVPPLAPWTELLPSLSADLFLVALIRHDLRSLGQVHRATWLAIVGLVPVHVVTPFLLDSTWWRAIGPGIMSLAP